MERAEILTENSKWKVVNRCAGDAGWRHSGAVQIWIEARSSLHPIHGEGTGDQGEAELEVTDGRIDLSVPLKARIELPVEADYAPGMPPGHGVRRRIGAQK